MKKALVVENNPVLLRAVSAILEQEGLEVQTANNGLQALEILENLTPDLVFTDLVMPLVGGEQLCRIIRSTPKIAHVFLVILSAIILEEKEQILQEIDCDLCIAKGSLKEMRAHIRQALNTFESRSKNQGEGKTGQPEKHIPIGLKPSPVTLELLSEKRHISEIVNNLNEGILELSHLGKIVSVNKAALSIFGSSREGMIGSSFIGLPWGDHRGDIASWLELQLVAGGMERLEIEENAPLRMNDRILNATFIPIQEDATIFAVCIFRDITRQHLAEEHKRQLDEAVRLMKQMDAMSCMAGGFAHDFNNLLTVICGNLDILIHAEDHSKVVDGPRVLDHAQRAAIVAVDLVKKISCFSTFGIISREDVPIGEVVRQTADEYFRKNGGSFDLVLTGGESYVHIDPSQIRTALANVLENAREASGDREIQIGVQDEEFEVPTIISGQYVPAGRYSRIDVQDKGRGIERENILKIFDPYYSTKQRGTIKGMGLGLTIVYATLRNHGGCVVVNSEPDQGTLVSLFLPVFSAATLSGRIRENRREQNCRVMLIEEDEQLREIGRIMLEYLGYTAVVVADAVIAAQVLQEGRAGKGERVAIVIMDLSGCDAEQDMSICRALQAADPEMKLVAASASILDPVMEDCQKFGCVNTLPKPYSMDSLNHILAALQIRDTGRPD